MTPSTIIRLCFASVWLFLGLWCKILNRVPRHRAIVGRILGEEHAQVLTFMIGFGEVAIAAWILSGYQWKWSCAAQILLVATMNLLEFALAPDLLTFGRFNLLVALAYITVVAWFGFR